MSLTIDHVSERGTRELTPSSSACGPYGATDTSPLPSIRTQARAITAAVGLGVRLVVNSVTLDTEALLLQLHARHGGELLQVALAQAQPLGRMRGWQPARPVVQWSVVL